MVGHRSKINIMGFQPETFTGNESAANL